MGYNMKYPFSAGDLRDSAQVLYNYLEGSTAVKIPWDELRYIFGEIMYGGHIVDDWDRRQVPKNRGDSVGMLSMCSKVPQGDSTPHKLQVSVRSHV
mmetsp:Transcript_45727/g.105635  ORF Transcript_45727/g.105635 Transcript_45727/m.105635 type:complete len:96 (+) Transcript_45727:103-390(+)